MKAFFTKIIKYLRTHTAARIAVVSCGLVLIAAILAFAAALTVSGIVKSETSGFITEEPDGEFDCIIVLGCKVKDDGTPSDMLRDRVLTGVRLYKAGAAPLILMSGDGKRPDVYDEPACMKALAIAEGVPEDAIICDGSGLCTYDSAIRARDVFGLEKVVVVTQEYHLYRSLYDLKGLGLEAVGVAADLDIYTNRFYRNVREVFARFKDYFWVMTEHSPEYSE